MGQDHGDYAEWEERYRRQEVEEMPWYYPGLDPDFETALSELGLTGGSVLDLCTGPGTQALALAERGFSVTASDIADTAVRKACEKARQRGLDITFRQNDILDNRLQQTFDLVFDRGCFHLFRRHLRRRYPEAVSQLLDPGGYLLLKCFSHLEQSKEGPYRISPDEITEVFGARFEVLSIRDAVFDSPAHERSFKALFCIMRLREATGRP